MKNMKFYLDQNDNSWVFEDAELPGIIAITEQNNNVTLRPRPDEAPDAEPTPPTFSEIKEQKSSEVEQAFLVATSAPLTVLGVDWNGGYFAGTKYKTGYDLSVLAEQPGVNFKDSTGATQPLSLADAKTVLLTLGADYLAKDVTRDTLLAEVNAATTEAELDAIVISY